MTCGIEMKHLIFFKRTAEMEHMTKAAEELMVAQPFLSKTISELEQELGVRLFDHVGRGIRLNDCGKAFYRHTEKIFQELDDARNELNDMTEKKSKEFSLITNTSLYMPGLLPFFRKSYPDIRVHQRSGRRFRMVKMLESSEIDFAICTPPLTEEDSPELETIILIDEVCPIIFPENHWLQDRKSISLSELGEEYFISALPGYGIRDLAEEFFREAGISPRIIIESTDTSLVPRYVENGYGVAFTPLYPMLIQNNSSIRYIVTSPPCIGTVSLSWRKGRYLTETMRNFISSAVEFFKNPMREDPSYGSFSL